MVSLGRQDDLCKGNDSVEKVITSQYSTSHYVKAFKWVRLPDEAMFLEPAYTLKDQHYHLRSPTYGYQGLVTAEELAPILFPDTP